MNKMGSNLTRVRAEKKDGQLGTDAERSHGTAHWVCALGGL